MRPGRAAICRDSWIDRHDRDTGQGTCSEYGGGGLIVGPCTIHMLPAPLTTRSLDLPGRLPDEQEVVEGMRRGDQRAFDRFFDTYAPRVAAFAARRSSLDAAALEDVVQVTMINAVRGIGTFEGNSTLFTWLCQICRNHLADLHRKAGRQPGTQSLERLTAAKPSNSLVELTDFRDPLDECVADSTRSAVRRAVNQLPRNHARILELRYGDDLAVPAIAKILGLSESATESRLVRARQAFHAIWREASAGLAI